MRHLTLLCLLIAVLGLTAACTAPEAQPPLPTLAELPTAASQSMQAVQPSVVMLPTITVLSRPTLPPTFTPTDTDIPTQTPSATITDTPTPTDEPTRDMPTDTQTPASTGQDITPMAQSVWYVVRTANLRECPDLDCAIIAQVDEGMALGVDAAVSGAMFSGSETWYRTRFQGDVAYIHNSLLTRTPPQLPPTTAPIVQATNPPISQPGPGIGSGSSGGASGGYVCDCNKTCGQIATCAEAYYQLNVCGCSRRDSDEDGIPCESLCE